MLDIIDKELKNPDLTKDIVVAPVIPQQQAQAQTDSIKQQYTDRIDKINKIISVLVNKDIKLIETENEKKVNKYASEFITNKQQYNANKELKTKYTTYIGDLLQL